MSRRPLKSRLGSLALVIAFGLLAPSVAVASTPLFYLGKTGNKYHVGVIEVATDGTAHFGGRKEVTGLPGAPMVPGSMTLLEDGTLLGASNKNGYTELFTIDSSEVLTMGTTVAAKNLGSLQTTIEGAFTACDGRVFLGDSGADNSAPGGGIVHLDTSSLFNGLGVKINQVVATTETDIDGLGPGIVANDVVDSPGYGLDSGELLTWDYVHGTVTKLGNWPGTNRVYYDLHVLGREQFGDGRARLLGLSTRGAVALYELDPAAKTMTKLADGPRMDWVGALTGPMHCEVSSIPGVTEAALPRSSRFGPTPCTKARRNKIPTGWL